MEESFQSFDLAPALESLNRVTVTNVIRFEEVTAIRESLTLTGRWSA